MRFGLGTRLLVPSSLVVLAAIAGVAAYSSWIATRQFAQLEVVAVQGPGGPGDSLAAEGENLRRALVAEYTSETGWPAETLASLGTHLDPGVGALLFDPDGSLLARTADSAGAQVERTADGGVRLERPLTGGNIDLLEVRGPSWPVEVPGAGRVAVLHLYRIPADDELMEEGRASRFRGALNRWLLVGVIAIGLLALVVSMLFVRRAVRPIETLTAAARGMAEGDLQRRVPVTSGDEVGELSSAFNSMAEALQHTEKLRRDMVGDVAHELRTPLTNVRCQLEAMQDGLAVPDRAAIDSLHEEILLLGSLVEDLQTLTLASARQLRLAPERLDLHAEIERAVSRCRSVSRNGGPEFRIDVPADLDVEADAGRLQQILGNLLDNARAYTPTGGRIGIHARRENGSVTIRVEDSGPGLGPGQLANVFERFYRADPSRSRGSGGAGLGLAIVRQLVELHGGRVHAESEPGKGTTFIIRLPNPPAAP